MGGSGARDVVQEFLKRRKGRSVWWVVALGSGFESLAGHCRKAANDAVFRHFGIWGPEEGWVRLWVRIGTCEYASVGLERLARIHPCSAPRRKRAREHCDQQQRDPD